MDHDYSVCSKHNAKTKGKYPKKYPRYCCVPQCTEPYDRPGISFHLFPKDTARRKKWEIALQMDKPAKPTMRVCSRHFLVSNYFKNNTQRQKLYHNAVPSQNIPKKSLNNKKPGRSKAVIRQSKILATNDSDSENSNNDDDGSDKSIILIDHETTSDDQGETTSEEQLPQNNFKRIKIAEDSSERQLTKSPQNRESRKVIKSKKYVGLYKEICIRDVEIERSKKVMMLSVVQVNLADYRKHRPQDDCSLADYLCENEALEKCTQVNFLPLWDEESPDTRPLFTLSNLLSNNSLLFTFTGIHSIELLDNLETCVSEIAPPTTSNKKILSVRNRIILTMVKIKQNMSFTVIGVLFGINRQTCSNYFNETCPLLNRVLKVVIPKLDDDIHYGKTCTAKFSIAIGPTGLINEISASYKSKTSNKLDPDILNRCEFRAKDEADTGFKFRNESECESRLLQLISPPFSSRKEQLNRKDSIWATEIAWAKLHIERVKQRLRQYKILCEVLPWSLSPYSGYILNIAAGLINLGPSITEMTANE